MGWLCEPLQEELHQGPVLQHASPRSQWPGACGPQAKIGALLNGPRPLPESQSWRRTRNGARFQGVEFCHEAQALEQRRLNGTGVSTLRRSNCSAESGISGCTASPSGEGEGGQGTGWIRLDHLSQQWSAASVSLRGCGYPIKTPQQKSCCGFDTVESGSRVIKQVGKPSVFQPRFSANARRPAGEGFATGERIRCQQGDEAEHGHAAIELLGRARGAPAALSGHTSMRGFVGKALRRPAVFPS